MPPAQIARNPKTGQPIRILNLDTSAWRDQKTLAWLDVAAAAQAPPQRWKRWEIGATSIEHAEALKAAGIRADIVLALGPTPEVHTWLAAGHWREAEMVAVSRSFVEEVGLETLAALRVQNMICLDEMKDIYPFTGPAWDGSVEDAKALLALVLRTGRSFPIECPAPRAAIAEKLGASLTNRLETPPELILVQQYYRPDKGRRAREIVACLEANAACDAVDRIVLLNETACVPAELLKANPKISETILGKRLTYADVLRWIQAEAPPEAIVCFANSDIFLTAEGLRTLWSVSLADKFLALLRWDVASTDAAAVAAAQLFGPRPDSQDTWFVSAASVKARNWNWPALEFPFGQAGCDNAITVEFFRQKFLVVNPALTLRTYHLHASAVRNYDPANVVDKPMYLYISPTGLHDMRPVMDFPTPTKRLSFRPVPRRIAGPLTKAQAATFCTMVGRATKGEVQLDASSDNMWIPPAQPLLSFEDTFQTQQGLLFKYNSILVGRSKAAADAWTACELSSMAAAVRVGRGLAAPLSDATAKSAGRYVTEYLGKMFLMRREEPAGEFWCSRAPECEQALRMFQWPAREVPVVGREDTQQMWCESVLAWPHSDAAAAVTAEEIDALREAFGLGGWAATPDTTTNSIVVVVDEDWMTDPMVERLEAAFPNRIEVLWAKRTALDVALRTLRGAAGLVVTSTAALADWSWVLPRGARVWEIQSEMAPSIRLLHQSGAAGLEHRLVITPKGGATEVERGRVVDTLLAELGGGAPAAAAPSASSESEPPTLFLPQQPPTSFFHHAGDSFRELAELWAARGYVKLQRAPDLTQVWLGAPGDTLLYDRPTLQWQEAAPATEQTWRQALFGNPAPPAGASSAKPWIFWPRRPALVEAAVATGKPLTPFESRPRRLAFYGRSENAVQRSRRTGADWSAACDDWVHAEGNSKYAFTQEEYLERLAGSRFGLCLAGFGLKCHREIECMAMGCVPIVAPEVDMTNYADPPQEGIHYFRAQGPEDALRLSTATSPEIWAAMSAACRDWWARNASVEGSWLTTQAALAPPATPQIAAEA